MPKPVKHSVAVVVRNGDRILAVRRPDNDNELPGIWGLPAGTCRGQESVEDVIDRVGRDKLGVELTPGRRLTSSTQDRSGYRLNTESWEASMRGSPTCAAWQRAQL